MFKIIVIGALRNLWRSKINTLINLLSLSIGLTVFAFAFIYVKKEVSYNKGWFEADRIHRFIIVRNGLPGSCVFCAAVDTAVSLPA